MTFFRFTATFAAALVALAGPPVTARADSGWAVPDCAHVDGDSSVTFTQNDGKVLTPTAVEPTPVAYTHVAALSTPDTLLSTSKFTIQQSLDAGCTWTELATVSENLSQYDIVAGPRDGLRLRDQPAGHLPLRGGPDLGRTDGRPPRRGADRTGQHQGRRRSGGVPDRPRPAARGER